MKTKIEFTVSVTVTHPKEWDRELIMKKANSVIGKNKAFGGGDQGTYEAIVKSVKPVGDRV